MTVDEDVRGDLASAVAALQAERDALAVQVAEHTEREQQIAKRMYRRGYIAGRAAKRRGAPAVANPERHARTWAREVLGR